MVMPSSKIILPPRLTTSLPDSISIVVGKYFHKPIRTIASSTLAILHAHPLVHISLLKSKVVLLAGVVSIAHFNGIIPHEELVLRWGNTALRRGSHQLKMAARTEHWGKLMTSYCLSRVSRLSRYSFWSRLNDAAQALPSSPYSTSAHVAVSANITDESRFSPPCSLKKLNEEYRRVLLAHRRQVSPSAPAATFDAELFKGCRQWNRVLEQENLLRHDPDQPGAELAGMSTDLMRDDPAALAKYIWAQFNNSPRHAQIQADLLLTRVAVSCTATYWVVRFQTR